MWIFRLALRRTYTFVVVALLIAVLGAVSIYRTVTDIFPNIDIAVVSVVWSYTGMSADEVETRIVHINERILTASVNCIESKSLNGVAVIRESISHRGPASPRLRPRAKAPAESTLPVSGRYSP